MRNNRGNSLVFEQSHIFARNPARVSLCIVEKDPLIALTKGGKSNFCEMYQSYLSSKGLLSREKTYQSLVPMPVGMDILFTPVFSNLSVLSMAYVLRSYTRKNT